MILQGGYKHEGLDFTISYGTPDFISPQGVHGTMQMPISDEFEIIKQRIRDRFGATVRGRDIFFKAHVVDDGMMEVNFEVDP